MSEETIARIRSVVGEAHVLTDAFETKPYLQDWRGRYSGAAKAVVQPGNTQEIATVVEICNETGFPIVPQAGNTGLVGGGMPSGDGIVLSVRRLNKIRSIDRLDNTAVVEAGVVLQTLRDAAEVEDRHFPMLLGSVGSCQVGGLISTNAGGTGVLRYGNMRDLVLGLEVVLPDGRIWNGMRSLRKDNTGYDLKQLFIGAEGTLGIVTAAVLKLFPRLTTSATAMVSLTDVAKAVDLLRFLQSSVGSRVEAFEVMSRSQIAIVGKHGPKLQSPIPLDHPWYVAIEVSDSDPSWDARGQLENILATAAERDMLTDAVIATDGAKAERIWALRHNVSEANKEAGFTVSNDTSVPVSRVPDFVANVEKRLGSFAGATVCYVGHIGDGNVHVVVVLSRQVYTSKEACEEAAATVTLAVHEESIALDGSISAEHGIGSAHVGRLERFKPSLDLSLMRGIKGLFDPAGVLNPGKIFKV